MFIYVRYLVLRSAQSTYNNNKNTISKVAIINYINNISTQLPKR